MSDSNELVMKNVQKYLDSTRLSFAEFGKAAGTTGSTISRFLDGKMKLSLETLDGIAKAMGCEVFELIQPLGKREQITGWEVSAALSQLVKIKPVHRAFVLGFLYMDQSYIEHLEKSQIDPILKSILGSR